MKNVQNLDQYKLFTCYFNSETRTIIVEEREYCTGVKETSLQKKYEWFGTCVVEGKYLGTPEKGMNTLIASDE